MQVMPETAEELRAGAGRSTRSVTADELTDPAVNIEYGTAYLRYLVERYHEIETALAAYNAGLRERGRVGARGRRHPRGDRVPRDAGTTC